MEQQLVWQVEQCGPASFSEGESEWFDGALKVADEVHLGTFLTVREKKSGVDISTTPKVENTRRTTSPHQTMITNLTDEQQT